MQHDARQKYVEYLINKGKTLPNGQPPILINFEDSIDPIMSITQAVIDGLKKARPDNYAKMLAGETLEDYASEVYTTLLTSGFVRIIEVQDGYYDDKDLLEQASQIEDPEELMAFIFVKSQVDEKVAKNFTQGVFSAYYAFCGEKKLPVDIRFTELAGLQMA